MLLLLLSFSSHGGDPLEMCAKYRLINTRNELRKTTTTHPSVDAIDSEATFESFCTPSLWCGVCTFDDTLLFFYCQSYSAGERQTTTKTKAIENTVIRRPNRDSTHATHCSLFCITMSNHFQFRAKTYKKHQETREKAKYKRFPLRSPLRCFLLSTVKFDTRRLPTHY